jgi:hypothetical protein
MPRLTTLKAMRKLLLPGVFAAAVATMIGFHATGVSAQGDQLWSIAVHIEYQSGFVYEHVFAEGVSTETMPSILADCARFHGTNRGVVNYYCFPIPE